MKNRTRVFPVLVIAFLAFAVGFGCTPDSERKVWISDTGTKYHRSSCQYVTSNFYPVTLADAQSRGLTACSVCDP